MDLKSYFLRTFEFAKKNKGCLSQQAFNELLQRANPHYAGNASTLSKLKGEGIGDGARLQLIRALDALCVNWQITDTQLPKLDENSRAPRNRKLPLQSVPASLAGRWLFVQHRSVRKDPKSKFPESGYRTAILTYGKSNKRRRDIAIIGESTGWIGHVQMLDKKLYHFADESHRTGTVQESAYFITFLPFDGEKPPAQRGVVLGISRGQYEHHAPPVYASRLLLRRLPENMDTHETSPDTLREQFCGYFTPRARRRQNMSAASWQFLLESFKIFDKSGRSPHSNGNRIFVNPH